eukprot:2640428-Pyramimonas_sp.AAC.1
MHPHAGGKGPSLAAGSPRAPHPRRVGASASRAAVGGQPEGPPPMTAEPSASTSGGPLSELPRVAREAQLSQTAAAAAST